jgi:hypothetical protein
VRQLSAPGLQLLLPCSARVRQGRLRVHAPRGALLALARRWALSRPGGALPIHPRQAAPGAPAPPPPPAAAAPPWRGRPGARAAPRWRPPAPAVRPAARAQAPPGPAAQPPGRRPAGWVTPSNLRPGPPSLPVLSHRLMSDPGVSAPDRYGQRPDRSRGLVCPRYLQAQRPAAQLQIRQHGAAPYLPGPHQTAKRRRQQWTDMEAARQPRRRRTSASSASRMRLRCPTSSSTAPGTVGCAGMLVSTLGPHTREVEQCVRRCVSQRDRTAGNVRERRVAGPLLQRPPLLAHGRQLSRRRGLHLVCPAPSLRGSRPSRPQGPRVSGKAARVRLLQTACPHATPPGQGLG